MSAFAQGWILSRTLAAFFAIALVLYGSRTALRLLRSWRVGATNEGQLVLQRRAELVATLVAAGLGLTLLGLVITLVGADRQSHTIHGAMCAYGVFSGTEGGFLSVGLSFGTALACAVWLVMHRFELRLRTPTFTRAKFLALFALAPLVVTDGLVFVRFASRLDLSANATCCSASLGGGGADVFGTSGGGGQLFFGVFIAAALVTVALLLAGVRYRSAHYLAALSGGAALVTGLLATMRYVAPHAYETPHHTCPFCLLHGIYAPFGWSLLAAFFVGVSLSTSAAVLAFLGRRAGEPEVTLAARKVLARRGALAWAAAALLAAAPVLRYLILTGTPLL
ncbi:MAG: hypothetical protein ACI9KE_001717 [Polyangiales bacterium]|jgi:hypothetical protein